MKTRLANRWSRFSNREKQVLLLGFASVLLYIFYQWFFIPYLDAVTNLRKNIDSTEDTLLYMKATDERIKVLEKQVQSKNQVTSPVVILTYLQSKVTSVGLQRSLKELKQVTSDTLGLSFADVDFDKMMSLLIDVLKTHRLTIDQMTVTREKLQGKVNADIVLRII